MLPGSPVIALRRIGARIGDTPILRDLDLEVGPGEVIGLHGGNGSGKTTLLRLIATLLPPVSGGGTVLGADLRTPARMTIRSRIGLVGHEPGLYPDLTLGENIEFAARVAGKSPERVAEVLDMVGLGRSRHRRALQCSHGMQRRGEFARLLLTEPDLLLLDEAHAGLDPQAADLVSGLVKAVRNRNGAAVLVSHDPSRIGDLVDRSVVLDGGSLHDDPGPPS